MFRLCIVCVWCCAVVFATVPVGDWTELTSPPAPNAVASLSTVGEEVFVYGEYPPMSAAAYKYSIHQDVWQAIASLPTARYNLASASVGGDAFSFGGRIGPTSSNVCYKYTVSADTWTVLTSMPTPRFAAMVASWASKIYVVAGIVLPPYSTAAEVYDVPSDTWGSIENFPVAIGSGTSGADSTGFFGAGGYAPATNSKMNSLYHYSFATGQWSQKMPMPTAREYAAGAMIGTKLWACGGVATSATSAVEVYDSLTDSWSLANPLPEAAYYISPRAAAYGGVNIGPTYLFLVGGSPTQKVLRRLRGPEVTALHFQGDPLITTLSGQAGHVDLFPATFNLFSSPTVIVNALIVGLPGLPANEDMVVTGIAVLAVTATNATHTLYCNTTACESSFALTSPDGVVSFVVDGLSFQVEFERLHVLDPLGVVAPSDSSFLNLHILTTAPLPLVGGLLGDAERFGFDVVRSRLGADYYTTNALDSVCLPSVVHGPLRSLQC